VIPEDLWYIIPAKPVVNGTMGMIVLTPSVPGIKHKPYHGCLGSFWGRPREGIVPEIYGVAMAWA